MPRVKPNSEAGQLYLSVNNCDDYSSVNLLRLTNNLLDEGDSDRLKRIAGDPTALSDSPVNPFELGPNGLMEPQIGFTARLDSPWSIDGRGLSSVYSFRKSSNGGTITMPEVKEGDLLWCAKVNFHSLELRHILPENLSRDAIIRVIERQKQRNSELVANHADAEDRYFMNLPEVDPSRPVDLFEGVNLIESGESVYFEVPPRKIVSEKLGNLELRVKGRRDWFKTRWDYGSIRFATHYDAKKGSWASGHWFPHAYILESVDPETGLPEVLDQERMSVSISLGNPYRTLADEFDSRTVLGLQTENGNYDLLPDGEAMAELQGFSTSVVYRDATLRDQIDPQKRLLNDDFIDINPTLYNRANDSADLRHVDPFATTEREIWVPVSALRSPNIFAKLDLTKLT